MNIKNIADKIVNTIMDEPCCKVCECKNGKKIQCACHRKQIQEILLELEGERCEMCSTLRKTANTGARYLCNHFSEYCSECIKWEKEIN